MPWIVLEGDKRFYNLFRFEMRFHPRYPKSTCGRVPERASSPSTPSSECLDAVSIEPLIAQMSVSLKDNLTSEEKSQFVVAPLNPCVVRFA